MRILFALSLMTLASTTFAAGKLPRVPPGFTIEKVTTPKLVKHPMMAGFDDRGRLFVACSAGKNLRAKDLMKDPPNFIKMLEDTNGDGKFDKATLFADKMTLPMGALWYRGALYVASPPHIWKLEDTNNDGVADKRTILVDKFGFNGNAASVHGCFLGPTGRIYWCDGRHGHEFKDKHGKVVSKGKAARIFSCKPDGSDVRVHCGGGMDNPVEIDFTETGEMIGTVNILLGKPRQDCLMHWVEGGVYPRYDQQHCLDEFKRTGDLLQPMTKLGHVAVSGMMRYRSNTQISRRALAPGSERQTSNEPGASARRLIKSRNKRPNPFTPGHIFHTQFNTHKVVYSELKRSGSTFTTTEHEFLTSDNPDFHPTDVLEDADGSLLVIDTGGWFRIGCPVSKVAKPDIYGAIYRIRRKGAHKVADPWGLKLDFDKMPAKTAVKYLDDPRWAVREKAINYFPVLTSQNSKDWGRALDAYAAVVKDYRSRSPLARRNAVWALGRRSDDDVFYLTRSEMARALTDPDESVRIAAGNSLANCAELDLIIGTSLVKYMQNKKRRFRRQIASALARIQFKLTEVRGWPRVKSLQKTRIQSLLGVLADQRFDRVFEHTIIYSLIQIADRKNTLPYLKHKSPTVRRAALIALDQMDNGNLTRELVTPLLDTDDPALQKTALAIIARHKGWAKETLSLLEKWLKQPKLSAERAAIVRGFLVAQAGDKNVQALVANSLEAAKGDSAKQSLLLEVMQRSSMDSLPSSWTAAIADALKSKDDAVRLQAVHVMSAQSGRRSQGFPKSLGSLLAGIARDSSNPVELRSEALIAAAPSLQSTDPSTLRWLTAEMKRDHAPLVKLAVARALAVAPWNEKQLIELTRSLQRAGPLETPVLLRAFEKSKSATVGNALITALATAKSKKSIPAHDLARLLKNYPAGIQKKSEPFLKSLGVNPAEQQKQIAALLKSTTGGDIAKGKAVFFSKKATCASCHTIANKGGNVGPDLSHIGKIRQRRDLIEAIAFPSASLARGFRSYTVVTERGKIHTGVITRQTSTEIVLRTTELAEVRIPRKSVDIMRESPVSIMPKGLDKTLSAAELRDLIAYLRSLR